MEAPPPYRIETERLVVRCWDPRDAPLLHDAVESSVEHLRPWMPWAAREPQPLDARIELLRTFRGRFDLGEDYVYGIFAPDESEVAGGTGLHTRVGEGALEVGYWIRTSLVGNGFATEVTAALTRVAFDVCGVDRVELRIEPENERSIAVPRKLGFTREATLRRRMRSDESEEPRDIAVFTLFAEELDASPCAAAQYTAYDAAGRRI